MSGLGCCLRSAGAIAALGILLGTNGDASVHTPIEALLSAYDSSDFSAVERHLDAVPDLKVLAGRYQGEARKWIRAPGADTARRRGIAAALGLEIASRGLHRWFDVRDLVEFGCALHRQTPSTAARDREWQLASVALLQGAYDVTLLLSDTTRSRGNTAMKAAGHLAHAIQRFPEEERFQLALLVTIEYRMWEEPASPELRHALLGLARTTTLREEVELRLAATELRLGMRREAATRFARVAEGSSDAELRYLAHHFLGRMAEQDGHVPTALRHFKAALADVAHGQSAAVLAAKLLFLDGERAEAAAMVEHMLAAPPHDPWRLYAAGDYRRWPVLLSELRKAATRR